MTLDKEAVEKAAEAYRTAHMLNNDILTGKRVAMEAALTAYFDALREAGKMKEAEAYRYGPQWAADTGQSIGFGDNTFPVLIIRVEE